MNLLKILITNTVTCVHEALLCITDTSPVFPGGISETSHEEYYLYLQTSDLLQLAVQYLVQVVEHARSIGSIPEGNASLSLPDGTLTTDDFGNIFYLGHSGTETVSLIQRITGSLEITWKRDVGTIVIIQESRGRMYLETSAKKRIYYPDSIIFVEDTFGRMYRRKIE